jgi:hypothetical protein
VLLFSGAMAFGIYGVAQWGLFHRAHVLADAHELAMDWLPEVKLKANLLIDKYGPPSEMTDFRLQWDHAGPWKSVVIQDFPQSPLQEVVTYHVPQDKLAALQKFSHGPLVYADDDELVARGDSEELNRLSLNLANDIVAGRRTPQEADRFYRRTVALAAAGKSSPYMDRLLFPAPIVPIDIHPFPW